MEPGYRVRQGFGWLRPLLCRNPGREAAAHGEPALPGGRRGRSGIRPYPAPRPDRAAPPLAAPADGVRQLDERPVPPEGPPRLYRGRVRRHGEPPPPHVPGAHEAAWAGRMVGRSGAGVAGKRLDGNVGGVKRGPVPDRASAPHPAAVRFLSCEPLLGPLEGLDLSGIGWVIAGGESGPRHRPVEVAWLRGVRDRCLEQSVPFFFKQWGGRTPKAGGRELDGQVWDQMPMSRPVVGSVVRDRN